MPGASRMRPVLQWRARGLSEGLWETGPRLSAASAPALSRCSASGSGETQALWRLGPRAWAEQLGLGPHGRAGAEAGGLPLQPVTPPACRPLFSPEPP